MKMLRVLCLALLALLAVPAQAEMTAVQRVTFAAAVAAETDAGLVACRSVRNDVCIQAFYNTATTTKAWRESMPAKDVFEAMNITNFDAVTAGKRDAWRLLLDFAPLDFSRSKIRKAVSDVWAVAADRDALLNAATENASRFELVFGGTSATEGSVTALKRSVLGPVSLDEVSMSLNGQ
ncbi:MAG: hypothetical protein U1E96_08740 [Azonexus sp.]